MAKFELFMGCLGNGVTVCNKAVTEHGDYKKVAHISEHGHIKLYVSEDYIPADAMQRIRNTAEANKAEFLEKWNRKTDIQKYSYMLDIPTIGCGYNAFTLAGEQNKHLPLAERVAIMEKVFFDTHM